MAYCICNERAVHNPCAGETLKVDLRSVFWFFFSRCDSGREYYICVCYFELGIEMLAALWQVDVPDEFMIEIH
jgi:hypothetical protein